MQRRNPAVTSDSSCYISCFNFCLLDFQILCFSPRVSHVYLPTSVIVLGYGSLEITVNAGQNLGRNQHNQFRFSWLCLSYQQNYIWKLFHTITADETALMFRIVLWVLDKLEIHYKDSHFDTLLSVNPIFFSILMLYWLLLGAVSVIWNEILIFWSQTAKFLLTSVGQILLPELCKIVSHLPLARSFSSGYFYQVDLIYGVASASSLEKMQLG